MSLHSPPDGREDGEVEIRPLLAAEMSSLQRALGRRDPLDFKLNRRESGEIEIVISVDGVLIILWEGLI